MSLYHTSLHFTHAIRAHHNVYRKVGPRHDAFPPTRFRGDQTVVVVPYRGQTRLRQVGDGRERYVFHYSFWQPLWGPRRRQAAGSSPFPCLNQTLTRPLSPWRSFGGFEQDPFFPRFPFSGDPLFFYGKPPSLSLLSLAVGCVVVFSRSCAASIDGFLRMKSGFMGEKMPLQSLLPVSCG